ncbi:hypothetical protein B296_00007515 [Ensete ventricosum]|uniref:Uncharacterized protein n=1 Tax=Ensete ventricosum TaxID=4639 RepID=A0A427AWD7_ENSVE|nr:hypothetical protein B296_00007515 [Ensete ventricosum]
MTTFHCFLLNLPMSRGAEKSIASSWKERTFTTLLWRAYAPTRSIWRYPLNPQNLCSWGVATHGYTTSFDPYPRVGTKGEGPLGTHPYLSRRPLEGVLILLLLLI